MNDIAFVAQVVSVAALFAGTVLFRRGFVDYFVRGWHEHQ